MGSEQSHYFGYIDDMPLAGPAAHCLLASPLTISASYYCCCDTDVGPKCGKQD